VHLDAIGRLQGWTGWRPKGALDALALVSNNGLIVLDAESNYYAIGARKVPRHTQVDMLATCNGNVCCTGDGSLAACAPDGRSVYRYSHADACLTVREYNTSGTKLQRETSHAAPSNIVNLAASDTHVLLLDAGGDVHVLALAQKAQAEVSFAPLAPPFPKPVRGLVTKTGASVCVLFQDGTVAFYAKPDDLSPHPLAFDQPVTDLAWGADVSALVADGTVARRPAPVRGYKLVDEWFKCCRRTYEPGTDTPSVVSNPNSRFEERHTFYLTPVDLMDQYSTQLLETRSLEVRQRLFGGTLEKRVLEVEALAPVHLALYDKDEQVTDLLHIVREIPQAEFLALCTGTFCSSDGVVSVWRNGRRHAIDRPAIRYPSGTSGGFIDMVDKDGTLHAWLVSECWMQEGERHRDNDEPAVVYHDGAREWWWHGKRHRTDGKPAIIYANGAQAFYIDGVHQESSSASAAAATMPSFFV
jgi:hypothetical protein